MLLISTFCVYGFKNSNSNVESVYKKCYKKCWTCSQQLIGPNDLFKDKLVTYLPQDVQETPFLPPTKAQVFFSSDDWWCNNQGSSTVRVPNLFRFKSCSDESKHTSSCPVCTLFLTTQPGNRIDLQETKSSRAIIITVPARSSRSRRRFLHSP